MVKVNRIIGACRFYLLRSRALRIAASAVLTGGFVVLAVNAKRIFGEEPDPTWVFIVAGVLALLYLLREIYVFGFAKPGRLRAHLNALPEGDRARIAEEFPKAVPEYGRYFLSEMVVFFPFDPGIIRYSMVDDVTVYPKSIGISGGGRQIFLKAEKAEDPAELARKFRERIPEKKIHEKQITGETVSEGDGADNDNSGDGE